MRPTALVLLVLLICSCTSGPTTETPPAATSGNASTSGPAADSDSAAADADVHVIDVRSQDEWNSGHVEQAVHIPHTEIAERISSVTTEKDAKIVLYCAVGGRAGKAKDALEELGYTNVENGGGYDDVKGRFE